MAQDVYRIELEPIVSSNLAAVGYDAQKRILAIEFKTGDVYHYAGVSLEMAADFYTAPSRGSFYSKHIRGKFEAAMMTGRCPDCGSIGRIGEKCTDCGCSDIVAKPRKERGSDPATAGSPAEGD